MEGTNTWLYAHDSRELTDKRPMIPLLKGQLGHFYVGWGTSGSPKTAETLTSTSMTAVGLHLYQTSEQRALTLQLSSREFYQIVLASMGARGAALGTLFKGPLREALGTLFVDVSKLGNAGVVIANGHLQRVNQMFLQDQVFRESLRNLTAAAGATNPPDWPKVSSNPLEQDRKEVFRTFILSSGYPEKEWNRMADGQLLATDVKFTYLYSLAYAALVTGAKAAQESPLKIGDFHSLFLTEQIFSTELTSAASPLSQLRVQVVNDRPEKNFYNRTGAGIALEYDQGEWKPQGSLVLRRSVSGPLSHGREEAGVFAYMQRDPRLVRANLLMVAAPLVNRLADTHGSLMGMMRRTLARAQTPWELALPVIEKRPCAGARFETPEGITLPEVPGAVCLKENSPAALAGRRGLICLPKDRMAQSPNKPSAAKTEVASAKSSAGEAERCTDAHTMENYQVHYPFLEAKISRAIGKNSSGVVAVPLENFLALFSEDRSIESLTDPLNRVISPQLAYEEGLGIKAKLAEQVSPAHVEHLRKFKDYYQRYWNAEIRVVCDYLSNSWDSKGVLLEMSEAGLCNKDDSVPASAPGDTSSLLHQTEAVPFGR
jgi:hypothetical protein